MAAYSVVRNDMRGIVDIDFHGTDLRRTLFAVHGKTAPHESPFVGDTALHRSQRSGIAKNGERRVRRRHALDPRAIIVRHDLLGNAEQTHDQIHHMTAEILHHAAL